MTTTTATTTDDDRADLRCPGCGQSFRGERGLRAHQSRRFVTIACRPAR